MKNLLFGCLLLLSVSLQAQPLSHTLRTAHSFALGDSTFLLDGRPFQMISGELHYTRVPREAWRARMRMAKAMGLNTIGTYVFWNVHEPEKGRFDFTGNNDIAAFVRTAQEEGLWVVLRPSPYVCAEWEFGGYPYWLQTEPGLVVRSKEPHYLAEYRRYILEVGRQLAPLQVNHGGNILMVQIENEYGSYGGDKDYLAINRQMFLDAGFDGLLYTCDPPPDVVRGYLPGLLPAVNGSVPPRRVRQLVNEYHNGKGPYYIAEWYPAWFDWWGTPHHTVPAAGYAAFLDTLLGAGISINMYMFHGGTTRGFMNGANGSDRKPFEPQISSYDYDAPLDEAGNPTPKFMLFRKVIAAHLPAGTVLPEVPAPKPAIGISSIRFTAQASLFDLLPPPVRAEKPLTFEDLRQAYGYVLYRTELRGGRSAGPTERHPGGKSETHPEARTDGQSKTSAEKRSGWLRIGGLRDFGIVFVNGRRVGVLDRRLGQDSLRVELPVGTVRLDILVENLGRINFGPYLLKNRKGITGDVEWNGQVLTGWKMFRLPFTHPDSICFGRAPSPRESPSSGRETSPSPRESPSTGRETSSSPRESPSTGRETSPSPGGHPTADAPLVRRGVFTLDHPADTYLDMSRWGKGCVWVNGHHLGRYWYIGPQQTLYLPAEWLKKGENEIITFELLKPEQQELQGIDHPILNVLQGSDK